MEALYHGIVVKEALEDDALLRELPLEKVRVTGQIRPEGRWHLYQVRVSWQQLQQLANQVLEGWYIHFWVDREVVACFHRKQFRFNYDDRGTWKEVLQHGRLLGIPEEQLDFPIKGL